MTTVALIIPAAGSGERLDQDIPKPYIKIAGKSILEHTISRFVQLSEFRQVIVSTSKEYMEAATEVLNSSVPESVEYLCVEGGSERQYSIYNALQKTGDVELVAVHDAVRPFIKPGLIQECVKAAAETGGAVVGVKAKDTIKKVDDERLVEDTPKRRYLWQAQTPQIFRKGLLIEAYENALEDGFLGTDDSALVERLGFQVKMIEGGRDNFKITYPMDLKLAKLLLEEQSK